MITLKGRVSSGKNNASYWLNRSNSEYKKKLGLETLFPGSLNILLSEPSHYKMLAPENTNLIIIEMDEFGWERRIIMQPCTIKERKAFIWRTHNAERDDTHLIELITDVKLRDALSLKDGDEVEVIVLR